MDVLRCRSPEMVEKEILMHFIAYNAIPLLMVEAATEVGQMPRRLSFKPCANRSPCSAERTIRRSNGDCWGHFDLQSPDISCLIAQDEGSHDA